MKVKCCWQNWKTSNILGKHASLSLAPSKQYNIFIWKTSWYLSKIILKSNCKHVPADDVVHVQNKCKIRKCFTYWGGDRKECNRHQNFLKKMNTFKKCTVTPTFYAMKWRCKPISIQQMISFWLWTKDILTVF